MAKNRKRYTQKNGRERGRAEGLGNGHNTYTPNVVHKGRKDMREREDRKRKSHGWQD